MNHSEYRATEAGKQTFKFASEGFVQTLATGNPKACVPTNAFVALGLIANSCHSPVGQRVLMALSDGLYNDPELAVKVWELIKEEVNR